MILIRIVNTLSETHVAYRMTAVKRAHRNQPTVDYNRKFFTFGIKRDGHVQQNYREDIAKENTAYACDKA